MVVVSAMDMRHGVFLTSSAGTLVTASIIPQGLIVKSASRFIMIGLGQEQLEMMHMLVLVGFRNTPAQPRTFINGG